MADGDNDVETINVAFRAVHSIKGGAGAFGFDELVSFSHIVENALDIIRRSGEIAATVGNRWGCLYEIRSAPCPPMLVPNRPMRGECVSKRSSMYGAMFSSR